jgi:hypothetical protein
MFNNTSSPTLTNVTFNGNSANDFGGGVDNYFSSTTLTNCILWGNTAVSGGPQINDDNGNSTVTYSDVQGGFSGAGNINADPLFVSAAQGNLRVLAGSPTIGAGTSTGAPAFDLDGNARPLGSIDMGAYQNQTSNFVTALGQLIPGGPTGNNALVPPFNQVMAALTPPLNIPAAATALKSFTTTAVDEVASGESIPTLINLLTGIGHLTIDIGTTAYLPVATQTVVINSFVLLANNIPGGLTGGNALVPYWEQSVIDVAEQNLPGTIAALRGFTSTAVGEVASATSGVNINTLITLLTGVGDLTNVLGATVYVPVPQQTLYITNFEILANTIPGGLTGASPLVSYWEQAITGLVEQNIPATATALGAFISTAVSEAGSTLNLTTLKTLEAAVLTLENGLGLATPSMSVSPSLRAPIYGQSLDLTAVVTNPSGPTPVGAVQFSVDGIALGNPVPLGANGQAVSANISTLSAATHTYSAVFLSSNSLTTGVDSESLTVGKAPLSVTGNSYTLVYGQAVPTLNGIVAGNTVTADGITFTYSTAYTVTSPVGSYAVVPAVHDPNNRLANYTFTSANGVITVGAAGTTVSLASSTGASYYGQSVKLTATVAVQAPGSGVPVGSVQFYDNGVALGSPVILTGGVASLTTAALPIGSDAITAAYKPAAGGDLHIDFSGSSSSSIAQSVGVGLLLLDTSGSGALTVSGAAQVVATGASIVVDSSSSSAINVSGSASVSDSLTDVAGKASITGAGKVANLQTGQAAVSDPLAGLAAPSTVGMTVRSTSTLNIGSSTVTTLQPGLYIGGINIGGAAKVTLAPGVYYFQGGGFIVGGSATVTGAGVMLYNAPAKSTDQINISGAAKLTLSAATTGTYAGITLFQARASNAQLVVSGSGAVNVTGTVYAAGALVNISGAAAIDTFGSSLIADDLLDSGSGEVVV